MTSPTASTDALVLAVMVDAHEKRNIGTADIATAYLKAKMDNFILLMFTGKLVDIICNMYPEYKKFVTMEETA
jgi:hypothetical protein